nr:E-beta-farnesene synthase [Tanacetum cinerariifolium]
MTEVNVNALAGEAPTMAPPVLRYDKSAGCYRCQLDEQWFDLTKDTLSDSLQITPVNNNQAFTSLSSSDALINFVNELGYPKLGIVTRAHINYAERIWEEFTQSIHTFIEDKRNLAQRTHGKKKATLIVILSIRFTKLIIYHLQRQHKFHPRPDSLLHLPNKEHVLGYHKLSAKGTKREVFGMPIPGILITADIQEASYYQEYLAKVAKHQRYLVGETGGDLDSPTPKPTKIARNPKPTAPKVHQRPSVSKPVSSTQLEPTSAPAKPQGKKRKLTTEILDKPSKAIESRHGFVYKKRKPISTMRSVDDSVAEDVPAKEPRVDDEEADVQWALEEARRACMMCLEVHSHQWSSGNLSPGNINRSQRCRERAKKMRTSIPTGSFGHDESSSLYAELGLIDSEEESEEVVPEADAGGQGEGQVGPDPGAQAEGQAGPDPDPGDAEASQPRPSPVVHVGSDHEHMDLDVVDVSSQPPPEQMDEGFTTMAYPKVRENLKLTVEEQVLLEEPASSSGTLSSLQHLTKDLSFDALAAQSNSNRNNNNNHHNNTTTTISTTTKHRRWHDDEAYRHGARLYILEKLDIPHQVSKAVNEVVTDAVEWAMQDPLRNRFRDLPEADMKEILHQRMWETDSYKSHKDHMQLYEALEKSMNHDHSEELAKDLDEARKKKKKSRESPKTPPRSPPHSPLPRGPYGASGGFGASTTASPEYQAWMTTDIRLRPSISLTPVDLQMDEDMAPDEQAESSDDEDIRKPVGSIPSSNVPVPLNNWASALASNYSPPPEDSLLAQTSDIAMFMDWFCKRRGITELKSQDLEGPAFEIIKVFHPDAIHLKYQIEECHKLLTDSVDDSILRHSVSKPLPLGGPPGQVTIQSDFFFNKDLEYLRYGSKGSRLVLSISKIKVAYYPDIGLKQMVLDQIWIEEECKYDIAAIIEVFSMYGYDYMKKIVLRRGILMSMLFLNETSSTYTQDATSFKYKHDYIVIDSPRAVTCRDRYRVQMIMRFYGIHKFSDGTLQQIDEALDYRVKEFRINKMNPGLNMRFWTRKDVDRSKSFMFAIQKRLKTRTIFCNLESFVGGRVRDRDYRLLKRTE